MKKSRRKRTNSKKVIRKLPIGRRPKIERSFSLIEFMVAIGILVLLLSIVIIAINPSRQFASANNLKRKNDLKQLSSAIMQNIAVNGGVFKKNGQIYTLPKEPTTISSLNADICAGIVPELMSVLPQDPGVGGASPIVQCTNYSTSYQIYQTASGQIVLLAPQAESGAEIFLSVPSGQSQAATPTASAPTVVPATPTATPTLIPTATSAPTPTFTPTPTVHVPINPDPFQ